MAVEMISKFFTTKTMRPSWGSNLRSLDLQSDALPTVQCADIVSRKLYRHIRGLGLCAHMGALIDS